MDEKVIQAGMFNNRSTGSERRELLQSILRADDQEEEEENEAPDDETINQVWRYFPYWDFYLEFLVPDPDQCWFANVSSNKNKFRPMAYVVRKSLSHIRPLP